MLYDMPLQELKNYKPQKTARHDFKSFWKGKIEETKNDGNNEAYKIEIINYIIEEINVYKVFYNGYKNAKICGYFITPKKILNLPTILVFHGYNGNKGTISHYLKWVLLGYTVFAIDVRGQSGESVDNKIYPGSAVGGFMTRGIFDKNEYYYLGVYLDCLKAIDFLATRKEVDISRLCLTGSSQGGGIALAVAALDKRPKLVIAEIPFLCHFKRAVELSDLSFNITYPEIAHLIRQYPEKEEEIFSTLSYFDNLNLCDNVKAKTIISCAVQDTICPPSTIFAVFNYLNSDKILETLPFSGHDYSTSFFLMRKSYLISLTFYKSLF